MSDDPRTDFFNSGGDTEDEPTGDARTAFFATGDVPTEKSGPKVTEPTYDAGEFKRRVGREPAPVELANFKATKGVGWAGDPTQGKFTAGQAALGAAEDATTLGTGAAAAVPAALGYLAGATGLTDSDSLSNARAVREAMTYRPRTEAGQAGMEAIGQIKPGEIAPRLLDVSGHPEAADTVREVEERAADVAPLAPEIAAGFPTVRGAGSKLFAPIKDPEAKPTISGVDSPQSMGAAKATLPLEGSSPQLQQAVHQAAQETGGAVNPKAYENHWEADQHGVQLTEGQATRDPVQYSNEQNSPHPDIVKRIGDQNGQLTDALDNIRREAAPGHVQNDPIENGQTAVDSLKAYDEPVRADIDAKYDAARKASANGDLQMDGSTFVDSANKALKPQSKFRFLPANVKGILEDVANADGKMTLDDYQAYDSQLGNEVAKAKASGDGNAAFAIGKVKEALNSTKPMGEETSQAKGLFDTARAAAKARFDALDADPAYRAAVDDVSLNGVKKGDPSAIADKFLDKYALQAPKANVDRLMTKLDPDAQQAVAAHTLSTIRKAAVSNNGVVTPSGYSGALAKHGPKLESLISPETRESLDSLGRVIHNVKVPPPGHFVNSSKTAVAMGAAKGVGQKIGEAVIDAKTLGMGMPVIKGIAQNNFAKKSLAPGAGLTKLSESPRAKRASGGKVDHEELVNRLIARWKAAKKETDRGTKGLLSVPDSTIVKALNIAQEHI